MTLFEKAIRKQITEYVEYNEVKNKWGKSEATIVDELTKRITDAIMVAFIAAESESLKQLQAQIQSLLEVK